MEPSRDAPKGEEIGWLIERGPARAPTYLWADDMGFKWTFNVNDAVRFARRADAEQVACIIGDDAHRIAEHMWMASSEPPLATHPSPPPRGEEMLRAQLKRYGRHDDTCGFWSNPNMMSDYKCTCGLVAALAQPPAPPSVSAGRGEIERLRDLLRRIRAAKEQKGRAKDRHVKRAVAWAALRDEINAALSRAPEGTAPEGEK